MINWRSRSLMMKASPLTTEVITVTITGANDAPVLDVGVTAAEQASVTVHGVTFTVDAAGADGDRFNVEIVSTHSSILISLMPGASTFTYITV